MGQSEKIIEGDLISFKVQKEHSAHIKDFMIEVHIKQKTDGVLKLLCKGISSIENLQFHTDTKLIISIKNVSDHGWESVTYSIEEINDNSFSFYADFIEIKTL